MRKLFFVACCVLALSLMHVGFCQTNARTEITIPDIPGYLTLACDLHMHTVFSDGNVWPPIRVEEAWREGLDAIAITDHIEYLPYKNDVKTENFNRSYELAKGAAAERGIILIRGAEITRDMPPGHFNAIFLQDATALNTKEWKDAIKAAVDQGAYIFWNHPGWRQPDTIPIWYPEHTELFDSGWVRGMEIVNDREYYPRAFQWCLEKNIPMLGNSDVHDPIQMAWDFQSGEHRPMTLVFATGKTEKAIKEALLAGRTAVYNGNDLLGGEKYLSAIFYASLRMATFSPRKGELNVQVHNSSCITFELQAIGKIDNITFPEQPILHAGKTVLGKIKAEGNQPLPETIVLPYVVKNLLIAPDKGLPVMLDHRLRN